MPAVLPAEDSGDRIVGRSPVMQEMCKAIGRIAPQDVNVLILGESGTGKELVARALYQHSRRAGSRSWRSTAPPFPETLLESELFGHEQGAFTGADRGASASSSSATAARCFSTRSATCRPALQAKMLRVLQDQRFERVGGNETVQTHVRVLAATNQDLPKLVAEGPLPQGPVLPAQRGDDSGAAAARPPRRRRRAGPLLPVPLRTAS